MLYRRYAMVNGFPAEEIADRHTICNPFSNTEGINSLNDFMPENYYQRDLKPGVVLITKEQYDIALANFLNTIHTGFNS